MDAEKWGRIKNIFAEVADLPKGERAARTAELCGYDASLVARVEALLNSDERVNDFIESPAFSVAGALPTSANAVIGKHIGRYRIIEEIGRGGMGTVFLAERDDGEFLQRAAIKVVSSPFLGAENLMRFRQERQILAGLNHPNIAKLLDGGVTDDGLPYLVMEYVEGEPLIEYAEHRSLSVEQKLKMLLKICRAVAHAHQNLIIHRDIKPSNIIVTTDGEPKLLDFGLAKILDMDSKEITAANFRALTPAYASPEQLRGEPVNVASDIYSLGIVFYEFITGIRPFDNESASFERMLEMASGAVPERPSSRLIRKATGDAAVSEKKLLEKTGESIKGDIDNIILKAMRSEPERRYSSVEQLSSDIERHLDGLPISATEPTLHYRATKFISRHRAAVSGAGLVLTVLVLGLFATIWQARLASAERDQARREKERTEQLNVFLQSILSAASPSQKGKDARVVEVMDDAVARVDQELEGQPELKVKALNTIGTTYNDLGLPDKAESVFRKALNILAADSGADPAEAAETKASLATSLISQYELDEAADLVTDAIRIERSLGESRNSALSRALFIFGELNVRRSNFSEAGVLLSESIAICDAVQPKATECAYYRLSLGRSERFAGNNERAEAIFREALALLSAEPEKNASQIADVRLNLGDVLIARGENDQALIHLSQADAFYREKLGDSINLAVSEYYLARTYYQLRNYANALSYSRSSAEMAKRLQWTANGNYVGSLILTGRTLAKLGKADEAIRYLRDAVSTAERYLRPADPKAVDARNALDEILASKNKKAA
jgi:serine/threonine protein kinase